MIISHKEAKQQGLQFYYTGKPCKKGHVCDRWVSCRMCKQCSKDEQKHRKAWKLRNVERVRDLQKKYFASDPEYWKKYHEERYLKNRDHLLEGNKKWRDANPGKVAAKVRKRQAAQMNRTPAWANLDAIRTIYEESARISKETGIEHHVDHMVPLQGKKVSGLHVEYNLQILPASENVKKHNRFDIIISS